MTAERIPGELRDSSVILVSVGKVMSHHQIRFHTRPQRLETVFNFRAVIGEEASAKMVDLYRDICPSPQQRRSSRTRFALAYGIPREHHPYEPQPWMALAQLD